MSQTSIADQSAGDAIFKSTPRPRVAILGVPFDNVTFSEALERIDRMVASRRPHYVVTPNADFLVQAQRDVELHRILCEAHLVLCDGTPVLWVSRLLGNALPERVAGSDLVPRLIALAEEKGYRIFLLGATPDSAEQAINRLRSLHPSVVIAGHYSPPFRRLLEMDHEEIARRLESAKPDILLVSLGCPKQEKWLAMHFRTLNVPVAIGVGATIDFLAGKVRRAPSWMQRTGTEWLFRLGQEPRRLFRRYLNDLLGLGVGLLKQWFWFPPSNPEFEGKSNHHRDPVLPTNPAPGPHEIPAPHAASPDPMFSYRTIRAPNRLDFASVSQTQAAIDEMLNQHCDCLLDLAHTRHLDSTGLGFLLGLRKDLAASGRRLVLLAPNRIVQRALTRARLGMVFVSAPDLVAAQQILADPCLAQVGSLNSTSTGSRTTLYWQGEILAANANEVWRQTRAHLKALTELDEYLVDLSRLRFIDSSGLGLMVRARKFALERHLKLSFAAPCAAVRNVLRLAGLEEFLLERPNDWHSRLFLGRVARAFGGWHQSTSESALASETRS